MNFKNNQIKIDTNTQLSDDTELFLQSYILQNTGFVASSKDTINATSIVSFFKILKSVVGQQSFDYFYENYVYETDMSEIVLKINSEIYLILEYNKSMNIILRSIFYYIGNNEHIIDKIFKKMDNLTSLNLKKYKNMVSQFKETPYYFTFFYTQDGIYIDKVALKSDKVDYNHIDLYFDTDFQGYSKRVVETFLKRPNGIVFFNGETGTGKTTAIRYIINSSYRELSYIFLTHNMFVSLNYPDTLTKLREFYNLTKRNIVFVFEDCTDYIMESENTNSTYSTIFNNLTEGLLNDMIPCSFLLTTNRHADGSWAIDKSIESRIVSTKEFKSVHINNFLDMVNLNLDGISRDIKNPEKIKLSEIYKKSF